MSFPQESIKGRLFFVWVGQICNPNQSTFTFSEME